MNSLFFLLALATAGNVFASDFESFNGNYEVSEYLWCNGPLAKNEPGSCSHTGWKSVDLDELKTIEISFSDEISLFTISDILGNQWTEDLKECNSPSYLPVGCKAKIRLTENSDELSVRVHEWDNAFDRRVRFVLTMAGDLIISTPGLDYLKFKLKKKYH